MKLPNARQALIPTEKLEGYSLNPNHIEGKHKAIVFQSALGIGQAEAQELRLALHQALLTQDAITTTRTPHGQKYRIDFELIRGDRQAILRSIWIIREAEDFPRLVTCYIL
jgi:hypothetical protein